MDVRASHPALSDDTMKEDIIASMAFLKGSVTLRILLVLILTPLLGLGIQPHFASRALRRAQHALDSGMNLAASQHLALAARQLPARPELWEQAGSLALQSGDPQSAVQYLEQAANQGLTVAGQLALGDAYLQSGDPASALRVWDNLARQDVPDPAALVRLFTTYLGLGNYPDAITSLQTLTSILPENAEYHYQLGLLIATQDPEAALAYFARAAELDPGLSDRVRGIQRDILASRLGEDQAYTLLGAGRSLAKLEEWNYAAEAFRNAAELRPDYAEAWAYLGEALQHIPAEEHSQTAGLEELQKSLELEPDSISANTFLALYWQRQGRHDLALEAIQSAVATAPDNPILQVEMGNTLALQGQLQSAYQAYLQAIQLAPQDARYYNYLVEFSLKYEYNTLEIALPAARRALLIAPDDPASLDCMGQVLMQLEDFVNAERFLLSAIQRDSTYAPAHLHLGMLYLLRDQPDLAYPYLTQAVTLAPVGATGMQAQQLLQSAIP